MIPRESASGKGSAWVLEWGSAKESGSGSVMGSATVSGSVTVSDSATVTGLASDWRWDSASVVEWEPMMEFA